LLYLQARNNQNMSEKWQKLEKNSRQKHGRPQKPFQGDKFDILLILSMLLTIQCQCTFKKRFAFSTP